MKRFGPTTAKLAVTIVALTLGAVAPAGAAGKKHVKADAMTGYQEAPGVSSTGIGSFKAEIDEDAQVIIYELVYIGLSAPATAAHIHFGNRFTAGGVSAFLCGGGSKPACPPGTVDEAVVTGMIVPADVIGPSAQGLAAGEFDEFVPRFAPASRMPTCIRQPSPPAKSEARSTTTTKGNPRSGPRAHPRCPHHDRDGKRVFMPEHPALRPPQGWAPAGPVAEAGSEASPHTAEPRYGASSAAAALGCPYAGLEISRPHEKLLHL